MSKAANVIAVKVLGDDGFGWWSESVQNSMLNLNTDFDFEFSISGIDWVSTTVASTGRPSVASIGIQGGAFDPVDQAVTNVIIPFLS